MLSKNPMTKEEDSRRLKGAMVMIRHYFITLLLFSAIVCCGEEGGEKEESKKDVVTSVRITISSKENEYIITLDSKGNVKAGFLSKDNLDAIEISEEKAKDVLGIVRKAFPANSKVRRYKMNLKNEEFLLEIDRGGEKSVAYFTNAENKNVATDDMIKVIKLLSGLVKW